VENEKRSNSESAGYPSSPAIAACDPKPRARARSAVANWVRDLLISLAIAAFIIIFLYQPVKVEGTSMLPGLADQERIFINKFVYRFESINRGDIVVFHYPRDPSKSYIKRVIGVAGDHIQIDDGRVYVNGHRLDESYLPEQFEDYRSYPEVVVPPHSYFVLGDHRNMSRDSRDFGPVDETYIYGKAVFGYWPVDKIGTLR
jgi:signal peptidase I